MKTRRIRHLIVACAALLWLIGGCGPATVLPATASATASAFAKQTPPRTPSIQREQVASPSPTPSPEPVRTPASEATQVPERRAAGLSEHEVATLDSLRQIDDHPLYTMRFVGDYSLEQASAGADGSWAIAPWPARADLNPTGAWACSLFAAMGGDTGTIYGRNFDWEHSPALLLFTDPPDGYASVSMVDIAYLADAADWDRLADLPIEDRSPLLRAPLWPFDGMNEYGLVVGMAAVPESPMPYDPGNRTIDSLMVIRLVLDGARSADEAIAILEGFNVAWGGGPPLHYRIADASGHAVLVEFVEGEMLVIANEHPYHLATNHLRASANSDTSAGCWRYDLLAGDLERAIGCLDSVGAMDLLRRVSQPNTQWSIVYGAHSRRIDLVMGRNYDVRHTYHLRAGDPQYAATGHR